MIDSKEIAKLRRSYSREALTESSVDNDPFEQFSKWLNEAINSEIIDANAMAIATADKKGIPSVRIVLLKGLDEKSFIFFTNYESAKAKDLDENPNASLLFFWKELERQVRISGTVEKTSREESEAYFISRPLESKLGAWASKQSSIIAGREILENKFEDIKALYADKNIPLPPFWGGFKLIPNRIEFWQGRESRLHDRICYLKEEEKWKIVRLSP